MDWIKIDICTGFICTAVNILLQSATLIKLAKNRTYKEGIKITALLLVSNLTVILYSICLDYLFAGSQSLLLCWGFAGSWFIFCMFQNISHWMFSYEYYNMVRQIPFVIEEIPLPEGMLRSNRIQYWFWMILNTVLAFLFSVANFYFAVTTEKSDEVGKATALKFYSIFFFGYSLLSIVSGIYLAVSIYQIKKLIA